MDGFVRRAALAVMAFFLAGTAGAAPEGSFENRAGAGGVIGSDWVARQPADGHSIVPGTTGTHGVSTSLVKNLPFHPERDFTPITLLATLPLAVSPSLPPRNLRELVAYSKNNPGKLSYGAGTASHIAGEYFKRIAGIEVVHVPYKGSAPALADVMAGHAAYAFAMDALGVDLVASTPEELATFQHTEIERWSRFIKESNITAD